MKKQKATLFLVLIAVIALAPAQAHAYIGPGAGFAFLGSTFVFLITIALAILTILLWPLQWVWRKARKMGVSKNARARRVVIVGLDGLEPKLVDEYMSKGELPNLKALSEEGSYKRLGTTLPALSPVAWSTFQTGVNPGAHNIFDFLTRDKRVCLPKMASTEVEPSGRCLNLGFIKIPLGGPKIKITRKSKPFWKILGTRGIFSNVIRVPISYPADKFFGNQLSAMCTPDLRGTQGSFTYITTRPAEGENRVTGGDVRRVTENSGTIEVLLEGPPDPRDSSKSLNAKLVFIRNPGSDTVTLCVQDQEIELKRDQFSPWIKVKFKFGARKELSGICRCLLREINPHVSIYISPVNIDPEKPCLPIANPIFFSSWLAKRNGSYGTLGLMEDTWGRNELALDDRRFLDQTYLTHAEREQMFFDSLARTREGVCVCVFDASDRIQHMFWRYLDQGHPAALEGEEFRSVIPEMYKNMDELVGRIRAKLKPDDHLIILSDHGFSSFRRGVNLNTWLYENGYLALKSGGITGADYFKDVDWTKTRAFAVGLTGIYINTIGREDYGVVPSEEVLPLKEEIIAKLEQLVDPLGGSRAVKKVYDTQIHYKGLYVDEAPDLVIGYYPGYRVSWDSTTGILEPEIFSNNTKAWSGDHHVDPEFVPGILFTNRAVKVDKPHISDIAPTVLDLFAVKIPAYMEGQIIM